MKCKSEHTNTKDCFFSSNPRSRTCKARPITSFRWTEAHEASQGNEETSLDNLRVAMRAPNELPLPGTLPLAMLALAGMPLVRRRRG